MQSQPAPHGQCPWAQTQKPTLEVGFCVFVLQCVAAASCTAAGQSVVYPPGSRLCSRRAAGCAAARQPVVWRQGNRVAMALRDYFWHSGQKKVERLP